MLRNTQYRTLALKKKKMQSMRRHAFNGCPKHQFSKTARKKKPSFLFDLSYLSPHSHRICVIAIWTTKKKKENIFFFLLIQRQFDKWSCVWRGGEGAQAWLQKGRRNHADHRSRFQKLEEKNKIKSSPSCCTSVSWQETFPTTAKKC